MPTHTEPNRTALLDSKHRPMTSMSLPHSWTSLDKPIVDRGSRGPGSRIHSAGLAKVLAARSQHALPGAETLPQDQEQKEISTRTGAPPEKSSLIVQQPKVTH